MHVSRRLEMGRAIFYCCRPYWRKEYRVVAICLDPSSKILRLGYCNIIDAIAGSRLDLWLQSTADEIPILGCVIQELWLSNSLDTCSRTSKTLNGSHWPGAIDLEVTSPLHTKEEEEGLSILRCQCSL